MPIFTPYKPPRALPAVGDGFEHATLDLKVRADLTKSFHLAKDVAAFANHLGGTLIIGAQEKNSRVEAYVPMPEADANKTQDAFSKEVAQRCSPKPLIDFGRYKNANGDVILTVLVSPSVGQPIGVKVVADKAAGGYGGDDAYAFPIRSGSDTSFLLPEQLAMYMLPELRKLEILLSPVKDGDTIKLHGVAKEGPGAPYEVKFKKLDVANGSVTIEKATAGGKETKLVALPLDAIRGVWKADCWHVAMHGHILNDHAFHWYP